MDCDLSAIVKSCSNHTTPKQTTGIQDSSSSNKGFGYLDALNLDDEDDTFFGFLDLMNDQNNGLRELENISSSPSNGDGADVVDASVIGVISRPIEQQVVQNYYQPPPLPPQPPATTMSLRQSQLPFHYQWHQWQHHQGQGTSNVFPMNTTQASPSRARTTKKGEKRVIQVAAEDLCSDPWQWRKYGQKPIKGSPFPRNYYRCSSSKACTARKRVERSHVDSKMFKVTYSGEHTAFCPPPNRQFLLVGDAPISQNVANNEPPPAASGGREIEGLSPVEVEAGDDVVVAVGGVSAGDGGGIEGEGADLLIPNFNALNDDLLKGFRQLGGIIGDGN